MLSLALHDFHARPPQVPRTSDVHPYPIEFLPVQGEPLCEEPGEHVLREVEGLVRRDEVEDLRFEDVDPRIRKVGKRFVTLRFLAELHDSPAVIDCGDPILRWI